MEMKHWRLGPSKLPALLDPDQEMVNFFTVEITKARQKRPTYLPYVIPDLSQDPWRPFYPDHTKAIGTWKVPNGSRKKTAPMDLSFQAWAFYNLRFLLVGDLAGAWTPFGGISAQSTHLGMILNMAIVENATIAMTYSRKFREQAAHLARQRATTVDWVHFLSEEDGVVKRNVLRELGHASATMPNQVAQKPLAEKVPKWTYKGPNVDKKGGKKGDKKGRKGYQRDQNNDWKGNPWKENRWNKKNWQTNDWNTQTNQKPTQEKTDQPAQAAAPQA